MKNIKILLLCALCIGILASCKKKDPCPDLGSMPGIGFSVKILDKNTQQDMIGINKIFHPDSVKLIGSNYTERPRQGYDGDYRISFALPFNNSILILYLNKNDRDTIKIYSGSRKGCANQPPYKIYYKGDLIKETSGNDDIYEAINTIIKK